MKIKYLGTAASEGWPALFCHCEPCNKAMELGGKNIRTRQQAIINDDLMFDLGPDTFMHMIEHKFDLSNIETLLVTHSHCDHWIPLELSMRGDVYAYNMGKPVMTVYGNDVICNDLINRRRDYNDINDSVAIRHILPFEPFKAGKYTVTALRGNHMEDENCYIYLVEDGEKCMLYAHDTWEFFDDTYAYLKDKHVDFASFDCTLQNTEIGGGHMALPNNARVEKKLRELNCFDDHTTIVVSHFSHNGHLLHDEMVEAAKPYGYIVAYDGMEMEI